MRIHASVVSRGAVCWRMTGMTMVCLLFSVALTVSVVASPQLLKPETADGDEWSIYTIYPTGYPSGRIRGYVSLALDSHNLPHMSYYNEVLSDPHDGDLKYARWVGSNWSIETVDSDGNVGAHNSLALDSSDHPHIAYFDNTNDDLKYAWWNGSAWNNETVDSAGYVGRYASMAVDSQDHPHVSYQAQIQVGGMAHYDLRHAWWNGSAWNIETVDTYVSHDISLALDSHDYPHVSYCDDYTDLRYARWTGSSWNIETVDSQGIVGDQSSLALDTHDFPHIGYYAGGTNDDLRYARWTGSAWIVETVDSIGNVGRWVSIALDSQDHPHMGYLSADSGLKYTRWNGTVWNFEIVDSIRMGGGPTSTAVDGNDYPHIGYLNRSGGSLKYATKAKLLKPYVSLNVDPDTLNLKSKGRWITGYLTTENAKAEDIDPLSLLLNDVLRPAWWNIQNETTLMVKFDRAAVQAILPVSNAVDIKITGQWKDGETFEVHDIIRVIDVGGYRESPWSIHSREGTLSHVRIESEASSAYMEMEGLQTTLSETDMSAIPVAPDGKERLFHYSSKVRSPESCLYRASSIAVTLI